MALQTNVLIEGEWVTQTININDVIKGNSASKGPKKVRLLKPPRCGILTRTVVESPLVNKILPVRLRTESHNDVAFIGNNSVQIREFCESPDEGNLLEGDSRGGYLRDIVTKNDFGSRIRNARVLGSLPDDIIKNNDAVDPPSPSYEMTQLPPQLLLLVLECGDAVFLFARPAPDTRFEFVTSRFPSPLRNRLVFPGFHLAVDPSSRYMAMACAEDLFVVYELESAAVLNQRYMRDEPLSPVRSFRVRSLKGTIHKLEFLHPQQPNNNIVVLLLIIITNGQSRMVTYDWKLGEELGFALSPERPGHAMPEEDKLPTLLIPLKTQSAFIMISEKHIGVCTEAVQGCPSFESCELQSPPPTTNHHGIREPLWTAWARPFRYSNYADCIYLVREDGHIAFLEADPDGTISNSIIMSLKLDCNTSGALACLLGRSSEILVVGGSNEPGVIYRVPPRQPMTVLGMLPNWAPTVDFITTDHFATWNQETDVHGNKMIHWSERQPRRSDRVFATSGRGLKGSITEFRYGMEAKIGIELDYGDILRQVWALPAADGVHLLLSLPDRSAVLQLSSDLASAAELQVAEENVQYDLTSRTLALEKLTDQVWVQVTEQWVVLTSPEANRARRFKLDEMLPGASPINAAVANGIVAIAAYTDNNFRIHLLTLGDGGQYVLSPLKALDVDGEVTCLSLDPWHGVVAAIWKDERPFLVRNSLEDESTDLDVVDLESGLASNMLSATFSSALETVASIATTPNMVALGTRAGYVVLVSLRRDGPRLIQPRRFGFTTAVVSSAGSLSPNGPGIIVSCDGNLVLLTTATTRGSYAAIFGQRDQIWPVDPQSPDMAVAVDQALPIPFSLPMDSHDTVRLLVLTGSRILFTEVRRRLGSVNRQLPVDGSPQRVMYSHHLQCLVVAVSRDNKPTLTFLDPDTGRDRGRAIRKVKGAAGGAEKKSEEVEFISGLGQEGDKVYSLIEWEYKKQGKTWRFIVVTTFLGQLLVVSTEVDANDTIRYWTRYKKRPSFDKPVYTVTPHPEGLVYCVGKTVYWDVLDPDQGLTPVNSCDLGSAATSLQLLNDRLLALTYQDSIEIIEPEEKAACHSDPRARPATHWIEIAGSPPEDRLGGIIVVADRDAGLAGLWVPWQVPGKACEVVFEAELPSLIRTLRRGRTRPLWHQDPSRDPRFGRLVSTLDDAEVLGMGLDGSLTHLTRLGEKAWRMLRFIQNLAMVSEELYPFTFGPREADFDPEPKSDSTFEMQVDGDLLQRLFEKQALHRLLESAPGSMERLVELLEDVNGGALTTARKDDELTEEGVPEKYLELAYDIIEYYLAPVL